MADTSRFPKLKFCGLTRAEDVLAAIEIGADAIGLNFFKSSPRYVTPVRAAELSCLANGLTLRVGVFVNALPREVAEVLASCPLDCVQLHGDETPHWLEDAQGLESLRSVKFIKAISWRGLEEDSRNLFAWTQTPIPNLLGFLVDAHDPVQRGGTGKTARWDLLHPRPPEFGGLPILLAGGLTHENLLQAIQTARPDGLDIASGIESAPGIKDLSKMRAIANLLAS